MNNPLRGLIIFIMAFILLILKEGKNLTLSDYQLESP